MRTNNQEPQQSTGATDDRGHPLRSGGGGEQVLDSSEGDSIESVLSGAGYAAGKPRHRAAIADKIRSMGFTADQIADVVWLACHTAANPCAWLHGVLEGSGDLGDAVVASGRARRSWGDLAASSAISVKLREVQVRTAELEAQAREVERRKRIEGRPDYHIDRTRDPNPIRRDAGLDPAAEASVGPAYRDWRFTVGEIAYWCGRSEDQVREILAREGVDLREGDR